MRARLDARLTRLEAQISASESPHGPGLASFLAWSRQNGLDKESTSLKALSDAALDAKIVALTGTCGLSLALRDVLEAERAQRQTSGVMWEHTTAPIMRMTTLFETC